jgi:hypothetical protein
MVKVKYTFSMQVENGPSLNIPGNYEVQIVDSGGVPVPKGGQEVTVKVHPIPWDQAEFVVITSQLNQYDESNLTYTIGTAQNVPLNRAHFLIGKSLAKLLGGQPGELKIKNNTNSDNIINIVVGRKATS